MNEFIVHNEIIIRLICFFSIFTIIAIWEILAPKRTLILSKTLRWANNLGLVIFNSLILRLILPTAAVGMAIFVNDNGWGMLNYYDFPVAISILIAVIVMDFIIYLQHIMMHAVPLFWRLHQVHHADLDYDVTTGSRFHPIEIILSMLIKFAAIIILGVPVVAIIIFEVILNAMAMFNHGNIGLPNKLDRLLRWFIVTPDMHRIHHSIEVNETNSNFGFNLACWDRWFGTYLDKHIGEHLTIGLHNFKEPKQVMWITDMLALPFTGKVTDYTINTRKF